MVDKEQKIVRCEVCQGGGLELPKSCPDCGGDGGNVYKGVATQCGTCKGYGRYPQYVQKCSGCYGLGVTIKKHFEPNDRDVLSIATEMLKNFRRADTEANTLAECLYKGSRAVVAKAKREYEAEVARREHSVEKSGDPHELKYVPKYKGHPL